jgi:hypothetical protein
MTEARIMVDPGTLRRGRGPATGVVWLAIGHVAFPTAGWNDFVVVILGWWAKAVLQLLRGTSKREEVNFMDGPYLVEVSVVSPNEWEMRLFETGRAKHKRGGDTVDPSVLAESIVSAAESVLAACRERNYWSADADALADLEVSLRNEVPALNN